MQLSVTLLGLVAAFSPLLQVVQSAPAAALDAATLLQNGQDAQTLNQEFKSLKASDPCESMSLFVLFLQHRFDLSFFSWEM